MKADMVPDDDLLALGLRALGHPVRLQILRILADRKSQCCCTDVTQCLPLAQSTVSQHIKVLLDAELIERHPQGTRNCYAVNQVRVDALREAAHSYLAGVVPVALAAPVQGASKPAGADA